MSELHSLMLAAMVIVACGRDDTVRGIAWVVLIVTVCIYATCELARYVLGI